MIGRLSRKRSLVLVVASSFKLEVYLCSFFRRKRSNKSPIANTSSWYQKSPHQCTQLQISKLSKSSKKTHEWIFFLVKLRLHSSHDAPQEWYCWKTRWCEQVWGLKAFLKKHIQRDHNYVLDMDIVRGLKASQLFSFLTVGHLQAQLSALSLATPSLPQFLPHHH